MEQEREPRDDSVGLSGDPAEPGPAGDAPSPPEQDGVDPGESISFWDDVDGILTGDFSADLLPKDGDYRLGAIVDAFPSAPRREELLGPDPTDFDDATGPIMSPAPNRSSESYRGAHDIDPVRLGFDDDTVASSPITSSTPNAVPPKADSGEGGTPLFDALPPAGEPPAGKPGGEDPPELVPLFDPIIEGVSPVEHAPPPLFDPTSEVQLSKQPGGASPISLERSTVVDPVHGPAPGSTFLEGGDAGGSSPNAPAPAPPTISFDVGGYPAPTTPAAHVSSHPTPVYDSRSILLDVVDRQWLTSGLVVVAALSVAVIAWAVLFAGGDDGGADLVAASTTVSEPAGPSTSDPTAAAASAGAGTGTYEDATTSPTTAATTEATDSETSRQISSSNRPRPTRRAAPSPAPAPTSPPTTATSSSSDGSPTSDTSTSDPSSTDTTDPNGTTSDTTVDGSVTTAGTGSTETSTTDTSGTTETTDTSTPDTSGPDNSGSTPAPEPPTP